MPEERKTLGRGLDSLLQGGTRSKLKNNNAILEIGLDDLTPGQYQPRKRMHKQNLEELAESIKSNGLIQPIIVKPLASDRYEIVAGERRWRAARLAGLETIPSIIKEMNNDQTAKISLIENIQREDLNTMDLVRGLQRLQLEFNMSQEDLGASVGKSRSSVSNLLRLLNLCQEGQDALEENKIDMGHARAILSLPVELQPETIRRTILENLSVRQTEALVKSESQTKKPKPKLDKDSNVLSLESELSDILGSKVTIRHKNSGGGKLIVGYKNLNQLEGILEKIKN